MLLRCCPRRYFARGSWRVVLSEVVTAAEKSSAEKSSAEKSSADKSFRPKGRKFHRLKSHLGWEVKLAGFII